MINTLYQIGKILQKEYPDYFTPWQNPFPNANVAKEAKIIVVSIQNGQITGEPIVEAFRSNWVEKYLFRPIQGARGTNLVPTLNYYYESNPEKYHTNISKVLTKVKQSLKNQKHDFMSIDLVDTLVEPLSKLELNKKNRYLLTFTINGKYFGEYEQYRALFFKEAFDKYKKGSSAKNKLCAVTYENVEEVWGRIDTLGFTVDKKPFSRNGFDTKKSYTMFPVAPEVVKVLEGSKKFVLERLTNNFYGLKYFILPHFIIESEEIIRRGIKTFIEESTILPLAEESRSIVYNEHILHRIIERKELSNNDVYYDIFFYQPNNAQFMIKLHLNDVLPSRLKRIFDCKTDIEQYYRPILFRLYKKGKKEERIDFSLTFAKIKDYFSKKVKTDTIFQPYFFKILEAVFYGNSINEQQLLKAFLKKITIAFKNRSENAFAWKQMTKESFAIYQFFYYLHLFKNKSFMENETQVVTEQVALQPDTFIQQHAHFFDSEFKKGVFLMGNLTQILLVKQYQKLKSEPFMKQLHSLNLDEALLHKILPKLINKLREYDSRIPSIEGAIAKALVHPCHLSKAEISYTFTLGMIMQTEFNKGYQASKKEGEEELG